MFAVGQRVIYDPMDSLECDEHWAKADGLVIGVEYITGVADTDCNAIKLQNTPIGYLHACKHFRAVGSKPRRRHTDVNLFEIGIGE